MGGLGNSFVQVDQRKRFPKGLHGLNREKNGMRVAGVAIPIINIKLKETKSSIIKAKFPPTFL